VPSTAHSVPSFNFSHTPSPPSSPQIEPPLLTSPAPAHPARGLTFSLLTTGNAKRDQLGVRRSPARSAASSFGGSEYASAYEGSEASNVEEDAELEFDDIEAMKPRGMPSQSSVTRPLVPAPWRPLAPRAIPPPLNLDQSSQGKLAPPLGTADSTTSSTSELWSPRSSAYASAFGGSDAGEDDDDEEDEDDDENEVTLVGTEVAKSASPESLHSTPVPQFRDHRPGLVAVT